MSSKKFYFNLKFIAVCFIWERVRAKCRCKCSKLRNLEPKWVCWQMLRSPVMSLEMRLVWEQMFASDCDRKYEYLCASYLFLFAWPLLSGWQICKRLEVIVVLSLRINNSPLVESLRCYYLLHTRLLFICNILQFDRKNEKFVPNKPATSLLNPLPNDILNRITRKLSHLEANGMNCCCNCPIGHDSCVRATNEPW